jgi:segregation and condensation protein B
MSNAHEEPDQGEAGGTEGDEAESASGEPAQGGPLGPGEADLEQLDEPFEGDEEGRPTGPGLAGTVALDPDDVKGALEALILVSDKPVPAMRLARLTRQDLGLVRRALGELSQEYAERGIALDEVAGGYQFRTAPRYAPFVRNLTQQKPTKLTRAQLEVLAIIAYRQPVTRPEIDDVRGVDSGSAIKVLLERDVIKIIGKRDDAGRPMLYATTNGFLELFGLKNLRDLPTLKEFAELSPESRDIYERRIGEPLPGQGQGMDLETHYEAQPHDDSDEHDENDVGELESEPAADLEADASPPDSEAEASDEAQAGDATLPDEP